MRNKRRSNIGKSIQYGLTGVMIIALSLGSIFSIELVRYSYFIFIISSFGAVIYITESITNRYKNVPTSSTINVIGVFSVILLMISIGIQSSKLPFEIYIMLGGIAFLVFALIKYVRNK